MWCPDGIAHRQKGQRPRPAVLRLPQLPALPCSHPDIIAFTRTELIYLLVSNPAYSAVTASSKDLSDLALMIKNKDPGLEVALFKASLITAAQNDLPTKRAEWVAGEDVDDTAKVIANSFAQLTELDPMMNELVSLCVVIK